MAMTPQMCKVESSRAEWQDEPWLVVLQEDQQDREGDNLSRKRREGEDQAREGDHFPRTSREGEDQAREDDIFSRTRPPMPKFWEMHVDELKVQAGLLGLPVKNVLKAELIQTLVELHR